MLREQRDQLQKVAVRPITRLKVRMNDQLPVYAAIATLHTVEMFLWLRLKMRIRVVNPERRRDGRTTLT